jgi:hypothetical protein
MPTADAANFALASFSSFAEQLAEAGEAALNDARRALTTCLSRYEQNGAVRMDACVHMMATRAFPDEVTTKSGFILRRPGSWA